MGVEGEAATGPVQTGVGWSAARAGSSGRFCWSRMSSGGDWPMGIAHSQDSAQIRCNDVRRGVRRHLASVVCPF